MSNRTKVPVPDPKAQNTSDNIGVKLNGLTKLGDDLLKEADERIETVARRVWRPPYRR